MWRQFILDLLADQKFRVIGAVIGFCFGLLTISIGLLKSIFVLICALAGFYVGKGMDINGGFAALVNKVFGNNYR